MAKLLWTEKNIRKKCLANYLFKTADNTLIIVLFKETNKIKEEI